MSGQCCGQDLCFDGVSKAYRRVLLAVIALNGIMFAVEMAAGYSGNSQALKADALDFLGDTATYSISLAVIGRPVAWRTRAALFKGFSLAAMGLWVLSATAWQVLVLDMPHALTMSTVGLLALAVNLASVFLLYRYKDGDANVRSVWLCSRNDALGNIAVIIAAGAVWLTVSSWPDLIVAAIMAGLFLSSAVQIIRQALRENGRGTSENQIEPVS